MIPESYKVDFSGYRRDLVQETLDRLLTQFKDAPVIAQIVSVYAKEIQELHDAIIDLMEIRTLYNVRGPYADVLGRLLGRPRQVTYADGTATYSDDTTYPFNLLMQTLKNACKFSSVPELQGYIFAATGINVSIRRTGPMAITVIVPVGAMPAVQPLTKELAATMNWEGAYLCPFPATCSVSLREIDNSDLPNTILDVNFVLDSSTIQ